MDDTTVAEIVPRDSHSEIQRASAAVEQWSSNSKLQLNVDKCKETIIGFKLVKHDFDCVTVNTKGLKVADHTNLLGVTISNNLKCNNHSYLLCHQKGIAWVSKCSIC